MNDIQNRSDIELLINEFYKKVLKDDVIGFIFNDVVKLNWETHIPVMYDFWESMILGVQKYKGNPMVKHIELNRLVRLEKPHFDRWIQLWEETILLNFEGPKATETIERAISISALMQHKIKQEGK